MRSMQSCQKAQIEKSHTLFRDIVPKGASFNHFSQDTVNLIFYTSTASAVIFTAAKRLMRCFRSLFPRSLLLFSGSPKLLRKMLCSPLCFCRADRTPTFFHTKSHRGWTYSEKLRFSECEAYPFCRFSLLFRLLFRLCCASDIHFIQTPWLFALTPISFLRLNPTGLH